MLDFDFVCRRTQPSVACIVYPFTGDHKLKFYWGHKEVLIPGKTQFFFKYVLHEIKNECTFIFYSPLRELWLTCILAISLP